MLIPENFSRHNLIKTYTKTHQTVLYFQNFQGRIFLYENSHFIFKILSKYTHNTSISSGEIPNSN